MAVVVGHAGVRRGFDRGGPVAGLFRAAAEDLESGRSRRESDRRSGGVGRDDHCRRAGDNHDVPTGRRGSEIFRKGNRINVLPEPSGGDHDCQPDRDDRRQS